MTITDWDSGKSIRKPISVSPYRARSTAPGSDVSVVEILLDTNSPDGMLVAITGEARVYLNGSLV